MPASPSGSRRDATPCPVGVHQVNVMMVLSPVVPNEDRRLAFWSVWVNLFEPKDTRRQPNGSVLYRHDTPQALQATSPTSRGTIYS
jgi:hypothetical protein